MFCQNCGKEIADSAHFCDGCGASVESVAVQTVTDVVPTPKRKSVFRRWWFWLIIGMTILTVVLGVAFGEDSSPEDSDTSFIASEQITETEPETEIQTEEPTTKSDADTEKEFKADCVEIDFDTLARNPDKYKGNKYVFTGEVIQVADGWFDNVTLRINITKNEYEYIDTIMWTDTIYASIKIPDGADRILEDDVITFWAVCDGEYTYESVLGANITLPKVTIHYYELVE